MDRVVRVLYVDDDRFDRELVKDALERESQGFLVTDVSNRREFDARLNSEEYDVVISDFHIQGFEGLDVIDAVHARDPSLPVVIVTGTGSEQVAVAAMKRGAFDYVIKTPHHILRLPSTILAVLEKKRLLDDRQRAGEALLASARRWQRTFDAFGDPICLLDRNGEVVQSNRAMAELIGPLEGRTDGCVCSHLRDRNTRIPGECPIDRAARSLQRETEVVLLSGRWYRVTVDPLADEDGRYCGAVHLMSDITERKRAEEAQRLLGETSHILSSLLDNQTALPRLARLVVPTLADACLIAVLEGEGLVAMAAAHIDKESEGPLGESLKAGPYRLSGLPFISRVLSGATPDCRAELVNLDAEPNPIEDEPLRLIRLAGCQTCMLVPLVRGEQVLGITILASCGEDYRFRPDRVALAEEMGRRISLALDGARLYWAAREAVRMRDEFLNLAAHELRTPITSLRGFVQLILRRLRKGQPPDFLRDQKAFEIIDQQSAKLASLVTQLLEISGLENEQLALDKRPTDISAMVKNAAESTSIISGRDNIVVETPGPLWAHVDRLRFEQVIGNLLDNAVRYSPDNSPVHVAVSAPAPGTLAITVRDHGIGIPPGYIDSIFDRFFQIPTNLHAGGMGLGLYISRHIVKLHGGTIEVESPPEGGSIFVVTLPSSLTGTDSLEEIDSFPSISPVQAASDRFSPAEG